MVDPDVLRWVRTWQEAGPELEKIRREEVRRMDNVKALAQMRDAYAHAAKQPARTTSGLIEFHRILTRLR